MRRFAPPSLCVMLLLASQPAARAGSRDDSDLLGAMPKAQQDLMAQLLDCARQQKQLTTIKNGLARKEASDKIDAALSGIVKDLNATFMTSGVERWVGRASVSAQTLTISINLRPKDGGPVHITVYVPVTGLGNGVTDAVRKLQAKEPVAFSIAKDAKVPARCRLGARSAYLVIDVPPQLLTAIGPAGSK